MKVRWFPTAVKAICVLLFSLVAAFYLLDQIRDLDFFWHLKNGQWIWQHKALPEKDPFSYTAGLSASPFEHFIITSYWASEVMYYLVYLTGGMGAIVAMRFLVVGAIIYVLYRLRNGDRVLYLSLMLIVLTVLLNMYKIERPHVFSFIFFALLYFILSSTVLSPKKLKSSQSLFLVPILMLCWSNIHGGVVVGQALIITYISCEGLKFLHPSLKPPPKEVFLRLLIAGSAGLLSSLINPNTYHMITFVNNQGEGSSVGLITEYSNAINFFTSYDAKIMVLYWFMLALVGISMLANIRRFDITEVALLAGTGIASFQHVRYVLFFMITALPFLGRTLSREKTPVVLKTGILCVAVCSWLFFGLDVRGNVRNIFSESWVSPAMPVRAADFIEQNDLRGAMYNHFNIGGYLIWRLAPERKVFIDGRVTSDMANEQATLIDIGYAEEFMGVPFWKSMFDAYGIRYVVAPIVMAGGGVYQLFYVLLQDSEWLPVYSDYKFFIFVKNTSENQDVIKKYAIQKDLFLDILIERFSNLVKANPGNTEAYIAKGDLCIKKGRFREAREAYENVLRIFPLNSIARERLQLLTKVYRS